MIDKLDVRIPCNALFRHRFAELFSEIRQTANVDPFHRTRHYEMVGNLQPFGYDAILHMHNRHGKVGNHKLELLDTGKQTFAGLIAEIESIFEIDATELEIMRLDVAIDIPGIPVSWFQERLRAQYKQIQSAIGCSQLAELGRGNIQTLYFGKRPCLFRIYDKIAEYKQQYKRLLQQHKRLHEERRCALPSFEEVFGVPEQGYVLTRVERQYGGGKIPEEVSTVEQLRRLEHLEPFKPLGIVDGGLIEPKAEDYSFETYLAGMQLRQMARELGMQAVAKHITRHSKGNTKWAYEKFKDFLPVEHTSEMVNTDYLNVQFQESIRRQFLASA